MNLRPVRTGSSSAPVRRAGLARTFLRESRGGTSLVLTIGAVVLLTTVVACFDLYTRVAAGAAAGRAAVTMADYVSREKAPDGDQIEAFGQYLLKHQLGAPADLVFVVSAIERSTGAADASVLWAETFEVPFDPADTTVTASLASGCGQWGAKGAVANLPTGFTMDEGEVVVVSELCGRLQAQGALTSAVVTGDIYRIAALPTRDPDQPPPEPVYAPAPGTVP